MGGASAAAADGMSELRQLWLMVYLGFRHLRLVIYLGLGSCD